MTVSAVSAVGSARSSVVLEAALSNPFSSPFAEALLGIFEEALPSEDPSQLLSAASAPGARLLVFSSGGVVSAAVVCERRGRFLSVLALAVAEGFRSRGVGSEVLGVLRGLAPEGLLCELSPPDLELEGSDDLDWARLRFYLRNGAQVLTPRRRWASDGLAVWVPPSPPHRGR